MKFNENEVLTKVFWMEDKKDKLGNLFFTSTDEDFINTNTIGASRTKDTLELFYTSSPIMEPNKKEYFVKLIFNREDEFLVLNVNKSSPEIKSEKDVSDVLDSMQNSILMMNSKPEFFITGVERNKLKPGI